LTYKPVIIIGAPRSGTNMLRDILSSFRGVGTWPCDEINYIWRHGNISYPSDEFSVDHATPGICRYIKSEFDSLARSLDVSVVIEKTCANALRVPFVDHVIPGAKYILILRDGVDVAGSAQLRWTADLDIPYILKKLRFVPKLDIPYYAIRYCWSRAYRFFSRQKRLAFWGPSLDNMQELLETHSLHEVCAVQWQHCVSKSDEALSTLPKSDVIRIKYEDFVQSPTSELKKIMVFIGVEASDVEINRAVEGVTSDSIGKGRSFLSDDEVQRIECLVGEELKRYGYI